MAVSALFWGGHSDLHGRRDSFNWSLIIATVSGIISAFAPNFFLLNLLFICIGFGVGSAVPVDSSILLEFLPSKYHYFVTGLSLFFNAGSVVASLLAYFILPSFSCVDQVSDISTGLCDVNLSNNGWRYLIIALSILEGIMVISRVFLFKLPESPQYLLAQNRLDEVVDSLNYISKYNGLTMSFTIHDLEPSNDQLDVAEDHIELHEQDLNAEESSTSTNSKFIIIESQLKTPWILKVLGFDLNLIYNLFQPYYRLSTILIWSLWIFQAAAFVLFTVFLPKYLELKGQTEGESSMKDVYWGYLIYAFFGIPGSFAGSWLVDTRLGRKGTLALSFLLGGVFQLGFIWFQDLDLVTYCGAAVAFFATLMCAVLFSYTPEVFDPRLRSTACGIAASLSRL
jgi:MFS family permease